VKLGLRRSRTVEDAASSAAPGHAPGMDRPLRIGLTARLMHQPPAELGFRNKVLQYLEQSIAHWVMNHGALALMVPTLGYDTEVARRKVSVHHYVDALDGLVMQGGADVSPNTYGQQPLRPEWAGDPARDRYEMELLDGFLSQGKPVLGICRGCQLLNVMYGGSLHQDIATQLPQAQAHVDPVAYDQHAHPVCIEPGSRLADLYPGLQQARVNSIHHQAIDQLGADLVVEARAVDDGLIEAIRARGPGFVAGVQWHPEFHAHQSGLLSGEPLMRAFLNAAHGRALAGRTA
jgi:putative glutamine amidotransferase